AELARELGRVEELRSEVARIEVEAEALPATERGERAPGGDEVVRDLGRVDLEPEADSLALERVEDRAETVGDLLVASPGRREVVRRERVEKVPHGGAAEAVHLGDAERRRRARGVGEALGRAAVHTFRVAVAPDLRWQDRAVALVDRVADRLADEV